jgi:hypothetical protein
MSAEMNMIIPAMPQIHAIQLIIALSVAGMEYIFTNESRTKDATRSEAETTSGFSKCIYRSVSLNRLLARLS